MEFHSELSFYHKLKTFSDFSEITKESNFNRVPSGWTLILSDIKGSTQAIQNGRYKDVNLIGAATITAYMNVAGTNDIPFIFGGDGATLLVPDKLFSRLAAELVKLQNLSEKQFGLQLRLGAISIEKLYSMGQVFKVAKYELSPGNALAQFMGGGLSYAEDLIKSESPLVIQLSASTINEQSNSKNVFAGLSCRLHPLKSTRGKILTILCKPLDATQKLDLILEPLINRLREILNNDFNTATPVRSENMKWPTVPSSAKNEAILNLHGPYWFRLIKSFTWSFVSSYAIRNNVPLGSFRPEKYKQEFQLNSDFRKYDETLRMVLDCTENQINEILALLEDFHARNIIAFGTHISESALMTCVVQDPVNNKHVHFVDGADGGYAVAAIQLKKQIKLQNNR